MVNKLIISLLLIITVSVPLFFDGHLYSIFDLSKTTLLYVLVCVMSGIWVVKGSIPKINILTYPVLAVLFSGILSTVLAVHPYVSFAGTYKRYGGLLTTMVYIVIFFACIEFVTKQKIITFFNVIILTASIAAAYGIIQSLGFDPYGGHWSTDFGFRMASTFGHPTFFGAYMAMAIPIAMYYIVAGKWWMYPVSALLMYVLFLSKARSAYVAIIVALIYFFVLYRKKISYKLVGIVVVVVVGLSFVLPNSPAKRFASDLKAGDRLKIGAPSGTIGERLKIGMTCLDIIADNPFAGIGLDCLAFKYTAYYEKRYQQVCSGNNNRAHNAILSILVEQGTIGLLAWTFFLVSYFKIVYYNRHNLVVISLSSGVVAYSVQNMFTFGGIGITPLFWMLIAMTVVAAPRSAWR